MTGAKASAKPPIAAPAVAKPADKEAPKAGNNIIIESTTVANVVKVATAVLAPVSKLLPAVFRAS